MEFTRVNNDVFGNPRYVVHFFDFLKNGERNLENYGLACKRANKIGGKKYRGADFGGGIVFQSYSITHTERRINEMLNEL